jgi:rsbT co-antagonist protein RsbR
VLLVDIPGVPSLDAETAVVRSRTAGAVRPLGAACRVVGISPQVAQTVVEADLDLARMATFGTPRSGLEAALRRTGGRFGRS